MLALKQKLFIKTVMGMEFSKRSFSIREIKFQNVKVKYLYV